MKRYFDWLIEHEKLLVCVNLLLIVLVVIQLKFCKSNLDPITNISQVSNTVERPGDLVKRTPGDFEKPADSIINIAGTWDMNVKKRRGGTQSWTLKLDQHGEDLSGVINSEGGDLSVDGTIKGQAVNLFAKRLGVTVEFPATVNGDTMAGEMRVLTVNRFWTAKRRVVDQSRSE